MITSPFQSEQSDIAAEIGLDLLALVINEIDLPDAVIGKEKTFDVRNPFFIDLFRQFTGDVTSKRFLISSPFAAQFHPGLFQKPRITAANANGDLHRGIQRAAEMMIRTPIVFHISQHFADFVFHLPLDPTAQSQLLLFR